MHLLAWRARRQICKVNRTSVRDVDEAKENQLYYFKELPVHQPWPAGA